MMAYVAGRRILWIPTIGTNSFLLHHTEIRDLDLTKITLQAAKVNIYTSIYYIKYKKCFLARGQTTEIHNYIFSDIHIYFFIYYALVSKGQYLYLDGGITDDSPNASLARLYSPVYAANYSSSACFSFWYHIFGNEKEFGSLGK